MINTMAPIYDDAITTKQLNTMLSQNQKYGHAHILETHPANKLGIYKSIKQATKFCSKTHKRKTIKYIGNYFSVLGTIPLEKAGTAM